MMHAWQVLMHSHDNNAPVPFDQLLSKLVLAQYAVNCMMKSGDTVLPEDSTYLAMVTNKIGELVGIIAVTPENADFIECAKGVLAAIQGALFHP